MFLKIGDLYINQVHIESIRVGEDFVQIFSDSSEHLNEPAWVFRGPQVQALLDWLANKAEVSVVC